MSGTQIWSPADMREKLTKWKESKRTVERGTKIDTLKKRTLTNNRKKKARSFVGSGNDENLNAKRNSKNSNTNHFGFRKASPKKFDKRKYGEEKSRKALTPVSKKCRTPLADKKSSVKQQSNQSVASIASRCLPTEDEVRALLQKKVCVGLRRHELSKKLTRLQGLLKATRASYNEYLSGMRVLVEKCQQREATLAVDADTFREQAEALVDANVKLEHTISNLKEEGKTHIRKITELIDSKKEIQQERDIFSNRTKNLDEDLKASQAAHKTAQGDIQKLQTEVAAKKEAYEQLQAEFDAAKEAMRSEIETAKQEQAKKQEIIEADAQKRVQEATGLLQKENTEKQVLQAKMTSLQTQYDTVLQDKMSAVESNHTLREQCTAKQIDNARLEGEITAERATCKQLRMQLAEKEASHLKSQENFNLLMTQNEARASRFDTERDALNAKLSELGATHASLQATSRDLETKCTNLESKLADAVAHGEAKAKDLEQALEKLARVEEECNSWEERHTSAARELATATAKIEEKTAEWEDSHSMMTAQLEQNKKAVAALEEKLNTTEKDLVSKTVQLEASQEMVASQKTRLEELISRNESTDRGQLLKQFSELLESRDQMSKQLSTQSNMASDFESAKQEIARLQKLLGQSETARRKLHNRVQELRGNIRVFVRVRPFLPSDGTEFNDKECSLRCLPDGQSVRMKDKKEHMYAFDRVFGQNSSQMTVFEEVSELVQSALDGYNVCIFSYGQTGSGKTYTMQGIPEDAEKRGLIPRSMEQILETANQMKEQGWTFEFQASFVEIYNEQVRDLLNRSKGPAKCEIKRSAKGKTYVHNVEKMSMRNMEDVCNIVRTAASKRAVGCTAMNSVSSRSHSVFTIFITGTCAQQSKRIVGALNLCDLAGSERLARSQATGAALKETQAINKSLSALADVFMALKAKNAHIPYRNSKLTYLLESCFSKDGKTMMLVNVSPTMLSQQETNCSMRFASQVNQCELGRATAQIQDMSLKSSTSTSNSSTVSNRKSGSSRSRVGGSSRSGISKRSRK